MSLYFSDMFYIDMNSGHCIIVYLGWKVQSEVIGAVTGAPGRHPELYYCICGLAGEINSNGKPFATNIGAAPQ